jgi:hypothetical protein
MSIFLDKCTLEGDCMSCHVLGYIDMAWQTEEFLEEVTIEKLKHNMFHLRNISSHIYIYTHTHI